jgi:hypothetical protein
MKNIFKILGILSLVMALSFSMAACGDNDDGDGDMFTVAATSATLEVTGLSEFNSKWIYGILFVEDMMSNDSEDEGLMLVAAADIAKEGKITAAKIGNNGKATFKVWELISENNLGAYTGSDDFFGMMYILSKETITADDMPDEDEEGMPDFIEDMVYITGSFNNGTGTAEVFDM